MSEETKKLSFNPADYFLNLKGKDYLPAAARIAWFREEHPDYTIETTLVEGGREAQYAIFRCRILDETGRLLQTNSKMEDVKGFPDFYEKAETGSMSRAVACLGYGTLQAQELDEGVDRIADTPQPPRKPVAATTKPPAAPAKTAPPKAPTSAPSDDDAPPPADETAESAPAAAPALDGTCTVCGKEVTKARLGYCSGRKIPVHCPTCTLPKAEEN